MDRGLIPCPYCAYEVIPGADHCDGCGQPLTDSHLPIPATLVERRLLSDRLASFPAKTPLCVSPTLPLREALRLLVDNRIGCLVVVVQGKVHGIFSERDVLMKIGAQAAEWGDRPVQDFMTSPVQTLRASAKIAFAVHRMDIGGFRHIPIVDDDNRPVGIVSVRDILAYLTGQLRTARQARTSR